MLSGKIPKLAGAADGVGLSGRDRVSFEISDCAGIMEAMMVPSKAPGDLGAATCRDCVHFEDDPACLEAALPHMEILSSAWGSTRGDAGLCRALGRFHDPIPAAGCPAFEARE
jgi:hypothetical protein